jgi:hypothetical protein
LHRDSAHRVGIEARKRLLNTAIANLRAFLDGHPVNVVK